MTQLGEEREKVDVASHDFSVRELVRMMNDDELNVAPSYQRNFRWEADAESLFVESVFLGLPVPPLFVATNVGFQWEVVDGLQRLSTLAHFLAEDPEDAKKVNRDAPLQLVKLEKLDSLNGHHFKDLPKSLRVFFGRQPLQVISLTDKSNLDVRFDVFERLNRGGVKLSPQEVRSCVYRGEFNEFIEGLAEDVNLVQLLKLQKAHKDDGTIIEQVLKFFAYKNFRDMFDGRVEIFLNKSMVRATVGFDHRAEETLYRRSLELLSQFCEGGPFISGGGGSTPLVRFEACLVGIAEMLSEGDEVLVPPKSWIDDAELRASSGAGSNSRAMLDRRLRRAKELFSGQA